MELFRTERGGESLWIGPGVESFRRGPGGSPVRAPEVTALPGVALNRFGEVSPAAALPGSTALPARRVPGSGTAPARKGWGAVRDGGRRRRISEEG